MSQSIPKQRLRLTIKGAVQGVGFRPFIYRLAIELGLVGWVNNSSLGVFIEVEGNDRTLETFQGRIWQEKPPRSRIQSIEASYLDLVGYENFEIRASVGGEKTAVVLPDMATCPDCLQEIFDPNNRRYRYPFTNCTNCGPRYSIIEALPYDRPNTTMKSFQMCGKCQSEYENPLDRRFHAQPNACPICGPHLELWDTEGKVVAAGDRAIKATADAIREGKILAIKGLGGFHLIIDAGNKSAIEQLRQRKKRPQKPFALMYPSLDLVKEHCLVSQLEENLLSSPEAPILLLKRKTLSATPSTEIAPGNPYLGVMLPYTPLHHLLMAELGFPVVATSGNISNEPICIEETEALQRLKEIADLFLIHDRAIVRPLDDSVVRVMMGKEAILRLARGYAPFSKVENNTISESPHPHILAVGAHLKNTVAIALKNRIFISQHVGDLATTAAFESFKKVIGTLAQLYEFKPTIVACDAHPDYLSSQFAQQLKLPVVRVQHHYAHVLSCMAENEIEPPVLGISWDGTGYGLDGTIWGGEFIYVGGDNWQRIARLDTFRLPGAKQAIKEPRRVALGLLYELFGDDLFTQKNLLPLQAFSDRELKIVKTMLHKNLNTPVTSSVGRLFDGVSSILGIRQIASFEGQAAMELEFAIEDLETNEHYDFKLINCENTPLVVDWAAMLHDILSDLKYGLPTEEISAKFHNSLVEIIVAIAKHTKERKIVLTGGCFQNNYLTRRAIDRLKQENFHPYWHQTIPPNDGGIALGQIIAALRK